jgi:F-type H+-transporting ATPase subunit delta
MKQSELAKRYAKAFYDISKSQSISSKVFDELRTLKNALDLDSAIKEFLNSPVIPTERKLLTLKNSLAAKISSETFNLLNILIEKGRFHLFEEFVSAFELISDSEHGVTRGSVKSASALSAEARKKVEETVSKVTNKKVILTFSEDPKLLGGMVAQVAGWSFDDSLDFHLSKLSEDLKRRSI